MSDVKVDIKEIKSCFEKALTTYDNHAIVQKEVVSNLMNNLLERTSNYSKVLELGCGTGLLTTQVYDKIAPSGFYINDLVPQCWDRLKETLNMGNTTFLAGNLETIAFPKNLDLIISASTFQWATDIRKLLAKCYSHLQEDGILAFSTYGNLHFKEIAQSDLSYKSKDNLLNALSDKFEILHLSEYTREMAFHTKRELILHLGRTGVNAVKGSLLPTTNYSLTYHPIIVIARRKPIHI